MKNSSIFDSFLKNLFTETRTIMTECDNGLTNENLIKAVTFNENLKSLGFVLKPNDILKVAKSNDLNSLFDTIKGFYPDIKAKPMYPDFPTQIMDISEAEFRWHQLLHYFSTYGVESLIGLEVDKGWLPDVKNTEKTREDRSLLDLKVVDIKNKKEVIDLVSKIASKTERYTIPEKELVAYIASNNDVSNVFNITFKENLFCILEDSFDADLLECEHLIHSLCKHSGDVLDFIFYEMNKINYKNKFNGSSGEKHGHFKESQKKMLVRALEYYGNANLKDNLVLKRNRNLTCLRYLSYNRYSKDPRCKKVVKDFRNKDIRSWYSEVDSYLERYKNHGVSAYDVIEFISKRPGELFRMLVRLYRIDNILFAYGVTSLCSKPDKLNMQTLISAARYFNQDVEWDGSISKEENLQKIQEFAKMQEALDSLIYIKLETIDTPIKDKKVYVHEGMYDFEHSTIETNDKSDEGGYIRSGLAFTIPEYIKTLRFFVYWNHRHRVDIDLHSNAVALDDHSVHVGWNGDFRNEGIYFSGDITHSDAAEYIDIDFDKAIKIKEVENSINVFSGADSFKNIDTVYTGMMAVSEFGKDIDVKLYDTKNVFFRHDLQSDARNMDYAYINVQDRYLKLLGSKIETNYSLSKYLDTLLKAQNVTLVETKEDADIILALDKQPEENSISLIDENYFMDLD